MDKFCSKNSFYWKLDVEIIKALTNQKFLVQILSVAVGDGILEK